MKWQMDIGDWSSDGHGKNKFTRKAWLWSFRNAVKINTTENKL